MGFSLRYSYGPNNGAFGNMSCVENINQGLPCTPLDFSFNSANNQITTTGYTYDAAGNLLSDNTHGYVYDAENRLTCILGTDGTCTSYNATLYLYGPDGQRVGKQQANTLEDYVYDPQGHISSVHDGLTNLLRAELYGDGRHVATWNPSANYGPLFWNHADWLGTERARTDSTGTLREWSMDTPFGMNLRWGPTQDLSPMHFTGKQRDNESGLDYFGARYLGGGNALGRFMTPDWAAKPTTVPYAQFGNPQSLNLYSYVGNNPMLHFDPDGHCWPVSACAQAVMGIVNQGQQWIQNKATATGNSAVAATVTFASGVASTIINGVASIGTMGSATGACMGGNGCSAGQTALAVGGDVLKAAAIAAPAVGALAGSGAAASDAATTTVMHFTNDAGVAAITESGGILPGGGALTGTFVTPASGIPAGATAGEVESLLEIGPGKGANSITFDTPNSNLAIPGNGSTTSGGASQFQLVNPTPIDPTKFKTTPQ